MPTKSKPRNQSVSLIPTSDTNNDVTRDRDCALGLIAIKSEALVVLYSTLSTGHLDVFVSHRKRKILGTLTRRILNDAIAILCKADRLFSVPTGSDSYKSYTLQILRWALAARCGWL